MTCLIGQAIAVRCERHDCNAGLGGFGGGGPGGGGYQGGDAGGSGAGGITHGTGGRSLTTGLNEVQEDGIKAGDGQVKITLL